MLSDVDRAVGHRYDAVRTPGDSYDEFPRRVAYLIDPSGTIARAYDVSDVSGFAALVLDDLALLQGESTT